MSRIAIVAYVIYSFLHLSKSIHFILSMVIKTQIPYKVYRNRGIFDLRGSKYSILRYKIFLLFMVELNSLAVCCKRNIKNRHGAILFKL